MYQTTNSVNGDTLTIFTLGQEQYSKSAQATAWQRQDSPQDYRPPWQRSALSDICQDAQSIDTVTHDGVMEVTFTYEDSQTVYTVAGGMLTAVEIQTNLYAPQQDGSTGAMDFRAAYQLQNIGAEAVGSIIEANIPPDGFYYRIPKKASKS